MDHEIDLTSDRQIFRILLIRDSLGTQADLNTPTCGLVTHRGVGITTYNPALPKVYHTPQNCASLPSARKCTPLPRVGKLVWQLRIVVSSKIQASILGSVPQQRGGTLCSNSLYLVCRYWQYFWIKINININKNLFDFSKSKGFEDCRTLQIQKVQICQKLRLTVTAKYCYPA